MLLSKIDAIPGRINLTTTLRLLWKGEYRGKCFESRGQGHIATIINSIIYWLRIINCISTNYFTTWWKHWRFRDYIMMIFSRSGLGAVLIRRALIGSPPVEVSGSIGSVHSLLIPYAFDRFSARRLGIIIDLHLHHDHIGIIDTIFGFKLWS